MILVLIRLKLCRYSFLASDSSSRRKRSNTAHRNYKLHSGCDNKACSDGKVCNMQGNSVCKACSLLECKQEAQKVNAVAFAYRGTGLKTCKFCDQSQLQNLDDLKNWGVYIQKGNFEKNSKNYT